jgi:hypothetical protein
MDVYGSMEWEFEVGFCGRKDVVANGMRYA